MIHRATAPVGPHLGDRVSAFVDETLPEDVRDRALVHVAGCADCRDEVEAARLMKNRLGALPIPQVSSALTARLLAMAEPGGPIPPRPQRMPGEVRPSPLPRPGLERTVDRPTPDRPSSDRPGSDRPVSDRPAGSRPAGRGPARRTNRHAVRLAALSGAALSTVMLAVVGLSGAVGSETRVPAPVSQLTPSGPGAAGDLFLRVSQTARLVTPAKDGAGQP